MAHINAGQLAADAAVVAHRAAQVAHDPATRKAWDIAWGDWRRAAHSTAEAIDETRSAWYRSGNPYRSGSPATA